MRVLRKYFSWVLCCFLLLQQHSATSQTHEVYFCGERIPVDNDFVANKLMDIIRRQLPNINLPALRQKANLYMPYIAAYLKKAGIPEDFKYLPIVESGFNLLVSSAGARGIWQIMPATGAGLGLQINSVVDDRDNFYKATEVACKVIKGNYSTLISLNKVASWVLAAAAYNFGIGNISKAVRSQGKDYFTMNLNKETAAYVYKIIAVKELFEYPELYMKGFGYNIFSTKAPQKRPNTSQDTDVDDKIFENIAVEVGTNKKEISTKAVFVTAHIAGKYKNFSDGNIVSIELSEDLYVQGGFAKKGTVIKGAGWVIDDRLYVDLGYGHDLTLYDAGSKKGIEMSALKKGEPVLLKNDIFDSNAQWK